MRYGQFPRAIRIPAVRVMRYDGRRPLGRLAGAILLACALVVPAVANEGPAPWPVLLRADLARLGRVEWRLRVAAGSACPRTASDTGIVFDDRRAYGQKDWPLLAATLGMGEYPVIAGIAPDSPAQLAGLQEGDEVLGIGGLPVGEIIARRKATALVADALLDEIASAQTGRDLPMDVRRGGQTLSLIVRPVAHCAARLVLFTDRSVEAHSDDRNVAISSGMLAFARSDDELALAAGHELAHVIHGDRRGSGIATRRQMEDGADELGSRLVSCAGYDRIQALSLFERLRAKDWLGFLRAPTHRSWSDRMARLRALPVDGACPINKS